MVSDLAVITMVSNPLRWYSRGGNFNNFKRHVLNAGANLYVGEVAYGNRPHQIYACDDENKSMQVIRFRTDQEIWHKENVINEVIKHLRMETKYIAWVDADVHFARPDWIKETCEQLQHYDVVQMFSHAQNLGSHFQPIGVIRPGYFYQYKTKGEIIGGIDFWKKNKVKMELNAHPGFAWAARKESLSKIGMLIDWAIVGTGDFHMAAGILGGLTDAVKNGGFTEGYVRRCDIWESNADRVIAKNIGYVPGLILHNFHGDISKRRYHDQQLMLATAKFDPDYDLIKDWQGLYQLHPNRTELRDKIKEYLRSRDEDSLEEDREIA